MSRPWRALIAALVTGTLMWALVAVSVMAGPPWSLLLAAGAVLLGALWLLATLRRPI